MNSLNDPWNHNSLQSWTTMLKTFFAIFSLAVFLLIQTTESHHMFRWELSQNKIFKIAFLKETFLRILWDQSCQNILSFIIYRGVGPRPPLESRIHRVKILKIGKISFFLLVGPPRKKSFPRPCLCFLLWFGCFVRQGGR